jgi:hypothetical protein
VTPAVERATSFSEVAFLSCKISLLSTVTVRGVFNSGSLNLLLDRRSTL